MDKEIFLSIKSQKQLHSFSENVRNSLLIQLKNKKVFLEEAKPVSGSIFDFWRIKLDSYELLLEQTERYWIILAIVDKSGSHL